MNLLPANRRRPARPTAVVMAIALTLSVQLVGSWTPPVAQAADPLPSSEPTPAPLESPSPVPVASDPIPTIDPNATIDPSPGPTTQPDPTADPGATPEPTLAPDPGPPLPSPDASLEPSPEPSATPIPWDLSNGQQAGADVGAPLPLYRLKAAAAPLDAQSAVHTISGIGGTGCASCHSAHRGQSEFLINAPAPGSTLCLSCHTGSGSPYDVAAQLSGAPANDAATDSFYRHLVEDGSAREATCTDCHNPHDANASRPIMTTGGWTASGDIRGADGVAVTNGGPGDAPTYTPISRSPGGQSLAFEYQLCLRCHSGTATLPTANAAHPSWWALDKGIELNPANAAFHPIEAAGKNQSTQMAASLAGTSPFKAWDYTTESTVRCTSCHGDPSTVNQTATATPKRPDADAQEATHATANRGILIAPYRDRVLKSALEPYDANDFALCYLCHAEAAFVDPNRDPNNPATAFPLHGLHISDIGSREGGGTSIDQAGAGEGLAICAECHFRIHSTAIAYKPGDTAAVARSTGFGGLVNFAPNVAGPASTGPVWSQPGSDGRGTCTLTCHGVTHTASDFYDYDSAPGTSFVASLTSGPVGPSGLTIQFADQTRYVSSGGATWAWDFGDGTTSTLQNPLHVYASTGTFSVTLTVTRTSDLEHATMTRAGYITVTP